MKRSCCLILLLSLACLGFSQHQPASQKYPSLLWEISGNGLKAPSYLFGTMHVSSKMAFHLSDSFYNSLRSVDMVALELDPVKWQDQMFNIQERQQKLQEFSMPPRTDLLQEKSFRLEPYETFLKSALSEEPMAMNTLLYRSYRQESDFEEDTYLDLYIYQTARKLGKSSTGVEDLYETEKLIARAYQDMALEKKKRTADSDNQSAYELEKKAKEAYRSGNLDQLDSLEKLMQQSEAFTEKFLYYRNEIQAHSIDTILRKNRLFVGVGAAHLPGDRGVIEILRRKGYRLRPIMMQDRDAEQKEAIDQMKVPVVFKSFREEQGLFSVSVPGKLYQKEEGERTMGWQYADMSNGVYYSATRVPTNAHLIGHSEETVMRKTDSLLYESIPGKIISKEEMLTSGCKSLKIINRTRRGDLQQYRIVITPFDVWVFKMSGPGEYAGGQEAGIFFSSILLPEKEKKGWAKISPENSGFSMYFPADHQKITNRATPDRLERMEWNAVDPTTGNGYALWRKNLNQLGFLEEDSFSLAILEESFKRGEAVAGTLSREQVSQNGMPALKALYELKNGQYVQALFTLRGAEMYALLERSKKKNAFHSGFFNDFSFQPYAYNSFRPYYDSLLQMKVDIPSLPDVDTAFRAIMHRTSTDAYLNQIPDYQNYRPKIRYAVFSAPTSGEQIQVIATEFPRYFYEKDTASFWKDQLNEESMREDFIVAGKTSVHRANGASGYHFILRDTNTRREIQQLCLLQQNRLYRVFYSSDSTLVSPFQHRFFSSFSPVFIPGEKAVTTPKTGLFLEDYRSRDSATRKRAREHLGRVHFTLADLDSLLQLIRHTDRKEKDYLQHKSELISEMGFISDSTGRVLSVLKTLLEESGDTTSLQNETLGALAEQKTRASYQLLKEWMAKSPPVYAEGYHYYGFFRKFYDSLSLTASLFPEMIDLLFIEDYKPHVQDLMIELHDSSFLKKEDYEKYFSQLYADARMQLKKTQLREENKMAQENDRYGYAGARSEDPEEMEVYKYARLLLPFYEEHDHVRQFFRQMLQLRDLSLKTSLSALMLRQGVPLPDSMYRFLASKDATAASWYAILEEQSQVDKFPTACRNQEHISRSMLLQKSSYDQFHAIEWVGREKTGFKGINGYVYFFKYKLLPDDEWQMGISGIQPEKKTGISTDGKLVRLTGKILRSAPSEKEQFHDQLIRLIFEEREASAGFFEEGGVNMWGY